MKFRTLFLTTILLVSSICISWLNLRQYDSKLREQLCHKWKMVAGEFEGKLIKITPKEGTYYFTYKPDRTLVTSSNGKIEVTKWRYDDTRKILTNFTTGLGTGARMKVKKITEKVMILEFIGEEASQSGILHFIRFD